jgi:hypothetical protein
VSHALLIMGLVLAFGGKIVGVGYIALTENKSTLPWVALSTTGYLMIVGSQAGALS